MRIKVFGGLKDYFEPTFELETKAETISELRSVLSRINPDSQGLLGKCRFAIGNVIVTEQFSLHTIEEVVVMPPSSGG